MGLLEANQKAKNPKKTFISSPKKFQKKRTHKTFQNTFTFLGLIHEINSVALRSLKWLDNYFLPVK